MGMNNWHIIGIEDSDGEPCECCGTACPKRRVILSDGDQEIRFGSTCAALRVMGNRKASSVAVTIAHAQVASLARKWIAAGHTLAVVQEGIARRFGRSSEVRNGRLCIVGIGEV